MAKCIKRVGIVFFALVLSILLVTGTLYVTKVVDSNNNSIVNTNTDNNLLSDNINNNNFGSQQIANNKNVNFEIPKAYFEYELTHNDNCEDTTTCDCLQDIWNEAVQKSLDTAKNVKITLMTDWIAKSVSERYFTSFGNGIGFNYGRITVHGDITLDLNGYTIDRNTPEMIDVGGGSCIIVWESILNLTDSTFDSQAVKEIYENNKSSITKEDYENRDFSNTVLTQKLKEIKCGKITGGHTNSGGAGGVCIYSDNKPAVFNMYGGMIVGNKSTIGGGVVVKTNTVFNLFDGLILDNTATSFGGGVHVSSGGFNMYGGKIIANTSNNNGAGVFVSYGQMSFYDGVIGCNAATNHGGGVWAELGLTTQMCSFQMYGGLIENNASYYGGGVSVYNSGHGKIYGGYIRNNYTIENSGGLLVWKNSKFEMYGGSISNNTTNSYRTTENGGAGVLVGNASTFEMYSGEIVNNRLTTEVENRVVEGAGLFLTRHSGAGNSVAKLYGGIIANNSIETLSGLSNHGAGVSIANIAIDMASIELNGAMQIYNNTAEGNSSDLYLKTKNKIRINGLLANSDMAYIGIDLAANYEGVFTDGYHIYNSTITPSYTFFANNPNMIIIQDGNEVKMTSGSPSSVLANWSWEGNTNGTTNESVIQMPYNVDGYTIKCLVGSDNKFYRLGESNPITECLLTEVGTYAFFTSNSCKNPVFNFTILPMEVEILWKNTYLTYNGGLQKPIAYIAEDDKCSVTTIGEQINSGNCYVVSAIELSNKNYKIKNNSSSISFSIAKAKLEKPYGATNFEYDGLEKEFLPVGFDSNTMSITGNTATNVGNYTATISLIDKDNYVWSDNSNQDIAINYSVTLTPPQLEEGEYKFIYVDEEGYRKTYKQGGITHGVNDKDLNGGRLVLGNIAPNTSVKTFVETLGYDTNKIVIKDNAGKEIYKNGVPVDANTYDKKFELAVGTGWSVEYTTIGGTETIYLSVLGDINGDGRISASDVTYLREIANDKDLYNNLYAEIKLASLIINKGSVTSADSEIVINVINQKFSMQLFF